MGLTASGKGVGKLCVCECVHARAHTRTHTILIETSLVVGSSPQSGF